MKGESWCLGEFYCKWGDMGFGYATIHARITQLRCNVLRL